MDNSDEKIGTVIKSERGGDILKFNNYMYNKNKTTESRVYWECIKRKHSKKENIIDICYSKAITEIRNGVHHIISESEHNHGSEITKTIAKEAVNDLKDQAQGEGVPSRIIQTVKSKIPTAAFPALPKNEALRKTIKRQRKNKNIEPKTLDELIELEEEFKKTLDGSPFLRKNIEFENGRILLFTTDANLNYLSKAKFWIMDGTFSTVPNLFYQLYTIHCPVGEINGKVLPMVYALMSSKSEAYYERLFEEILELGSEINIELKPDYILVDFELAVHNVIRRLMPTTNIKGCFFHFKKIIWSKIQANGLVNQYNNDLNFQLTLKLLPAMAYLSPDNIINLWPEVKSLIPANCQNIIVWFEENYIIGRKRRPSRSNSVVTPPIYNPQIWSVRSSTIAGHRRTTNNVEGWNNRWKILVGNHPPVLKVIKEIQKEQKITEGDIIVLMSGGTPKKSYTSFEPRIMNLLKSGNQNLSFLQGIVHNINI